jgi:hypothetical protein
MSEQEIRAGDRFATTNGLAVTVVDHPDNGKDLFGFGELGWEAVRDDGYRSRFSCLMMKRLPRLRDDLEERRRGLKVGDVIRDTGLLTAGMIVLINNSERHRVTVMGPLKTATEEGSQEMSDGWSLGGNWVRREGVTFLGWTTPADPPKATPALREALHRTRESTQAPTPKPLPFRRHPDCPATEHHRKPVGCMVCEHLIAKSTALVDYPTRGVRPVTGPPSPMNFGPHSDTYRHALPYDRNRGR